MDNLYTNWVDSLGQQLVTNNLSVLLVDNQYTPNITTDTARTNIPVASIISESNLNGKSFTQGVFDADDVTFAGAAPRAAVATSLVIVDNTTGALVAVMQSLSGASIAANGNDIQLNFNACGVFSL